MSATALRLPVGPWRPALLAMGLVLLVLLLVYGQTGLAMVEIWERSETFAHAFVVPPISIWLIWRRREAVALQTPRANLWFLLPMAGCALLWLAGDLVAVNSVTQLAFTALLVLAVPATLGWPVARQILFPLGFLFFAVPIGEFMLPMMMEWTANFTIFALRLSGVPVYREGLQFVIPSGNWSVVEACSGIRYLMASVMVGTLFAYLNYHTPKRRWIFVGFSLLLPLVANWVRAYMIVMLGHLSGNRLATGADHLVYGWVFFGLIMLVMFMVGARWAEPDPPLPAPEPLPAVTSAGQAYRVFVPLLLAVLLAPHLLLRVLDHGERSELRLDRPPIGAGWHAVEGATPPLVPVYENPSAVWQGLFDAAGGTPRVGLYVAYYRQQDYKRKLISSNNVLVKSEESDWARVSSGQAVLDAGPDAPALAVRTAELRGSSLGGSTVNPRLQALQFYWVNGYLTTSDARAKIYGVLNRLRGRGDDGAAIVLYTEKTEGGAPEQVLERFLRDNWGGLERWLQQTAGQARKERTAALLTSKLEKHE